MNTKDSNRQSILNAYNNLGVKWGASAYSIKKEYRKLAKIWHPDNWPAGSNEQVVANEKMKVLNDSYSLIKDAPLRYAHQGQSANDVEWVYKKRKYDNISITIPQENVFDGVLRFLTGVAIGLLIVAPSKYSAYWFLGDGYDSDYFVVVPVICGFLSYFLLDKLKTFVRRVIFSIRKH